MKKQERPKGINFLTLISETADFTTHNVEFNGITGIGKINKHNGRRMLSMEFIGNVTAQLAPHLMNSFLDAVTAEQANSQQTKILTN